MAIKSRFLINYFQHGIFGNLVGVVGLVGNALCVFVLTRPQMRGSTNLILTALASFDMGVILTSMLMLG